MHGFFYSGGTFSTLDDPLGTGGTFANGINNAGQIVGEYNDSQGTRTASCTTLIIPNTSSPPYFTLDGPSGSTIVEAFGINDMGRSSGTTLTPVATGTASS